LHPYIKQGWVELYDPTAHPIASSRHSETSETPETPSEAIDRIRLSDPEGFLFSNVVLSALFQQWA
jgi:oxygen-independent coproporphyrinogen-3 oxidase